MSTKTIFRKAKVFKARALAGVLEEISGGFRFCYDDSYQGPPVSLTMPIDQHEWEWKGFPPFFDGLLPEGMQLEALLKARKLDRGDFFGQLIVVGQDLVGDVTVEAI
jgi:serine/threonine-protein kinase HipA